MAGIKKVETKKAETPKRVITHAEKLLMVASVFGKPSKKWRELDEQQSIDVVDNILRITDTEVEGEGSHA